MGLEIPKLIGQTSSAVYGPLKDAVSYVKNKAKFVRRLEDNLTSLIREMITVHSRMKKVDRNLEKSVLEEKNEEYYISQKQIQVLDGKCNKFIKKYEKHCGNLPSAMPELDASGASKMIDALQEKKPTIKTRKFFKLAKLSKDVKELRDYISQVTDRVKTENLLDEKQPELGQLKHVDIHLSSHNEYVERVIRYLDEHGQKSIGIVGKIGVGKTAVMKKLNNTLKDNTSLKLEYIIWIDYPKDIGTEEKIIERMQNVIIERLMLKQEKANTIEQKEHIISTFLSQKNYIVLVDQVSWTIDLAKVGIHKDHEFGKVVVAASSDSKIIKQMTDQQVEIKGLEGNDAWDLFQSVCGAVDNPQIKAIGEKIIVSCGGLPLVITLVAKYLKDKKDNLDAWSDVKRILQSEPKMATLFKLGGVGNAYQLVYDGLEESYFKKCLLFGALFPSNHKIYKDYLVECWIAEGFLPLSNTNVPKVRRGRDRGATVLGELTDKYLLETCSDKMYVKMPAYFRQVALVQEYPEDKNCVIWVPHENELPNEETWRTITRMSLISCKPKLPKCPKSYNVSTLLVQQNPELETLEDSFFSNMEKLRVLDLNQTNIESLPTSIARSVNLVSLYLNDCSRLAKLPPGVQMLTKIEFLDIRGTSIPNLPQEIGHMIKLRCLRFTFAPKVCGLSNKGKEVEVLIHPNIISCLKQLEEVIIETGCCIPSWKKSADQIALELASLEKLSTLSFHFPSVDSLKKFVTTSKSWRNTETHWGSNTFRSFDISIGCCETRCPYASQVSGTLNERQLRFSTNEDTSSVKEVLKQASAFELVGHLKVESLSDFDLENAGALKACIIERCNNLLSIVDADKTKNDGVLQCLEKLYLFNLESLQYIWKGLVFRRSLSKLEVLTICGCHKLTWILDHRLAEALSSLMHLKVEKCRNVVEIVKGQDLIDNSSILQKVKTIELVDLLNLQSICEGASMTWNSLSKIVIKSCKNLRMPLTVSNSKKLETIKCEASWWNALQLSEEEKQHFHPCHEFSDREEGSSSNGRSVNTPASDNKDSQVHNNDREEGSSSNGRFVNSTPASDNKDSQVHNNDREEGSSSNGRSVNSTPVSHNKDSQVHNNGREEGSSSNGRSVNSTQASDNNDPQVCNNDEGMASSGRSNPDVVSGAEKPEDEIPHKAKLESAGTKHRRTGKS